MTNTHVATVSIKYGGPGRDGVYLDSMKEMLAWVKVNCRSYITNNMFKVYSEPDGCEVVFYRFYFNKIDDAVMFKLTWI